MKVIITYFSYSDLNDKGDIYTMQDLDRFQMMYLDSDPVGVAEEMCQIYDMSLCQIYDMSLCYQYDR